MHNDTTYICNPQTRFYKFLVVMCCISLYMHFLSSLLKIKIFTIKFPKDSLFLLLVLNSVYITVYHAKAVQVDIFAKTVPI